MREFCLTEEVIQQFVDGELSEEQAREAAAHLAACDKCASLLDEVEQQSALLTEAFAPELSLPVPSAQLRARLEAAIAELSPSSSPATESTGSSRVRNWFSSLFGSLSFTPQQGLGFASLAVIVAFAVIFAVIQLRRGDEMQRSVAGNKPVQPKVEPPREQIARSGNEDVPPMVPASIPVAGKANDTASKRQRTLKRTGKRVDNAQPKDAPEPDSTGPRLLPGEEGYLEAIASLTTVIEANKDDVLKPAARADYERNLASVDQAIATTRQQAKRNLNDRDAVEFMYTAYQNKIELLSAVADQTRIASR